MTWPPRLGPPTHFAPEPPAPGAARWVRLPLRLELVALVAGALLAMALMAALAKVSMTNCGGGPRPLLPPVITDGSPDP